MSTVATVNVYSLATPELACRFVDSLVDWTRGRHYMTGMFKTMFVVSNQEMLDHLHWYGLNNRLTREEGQTIHNWVSGLPWEALEEGDDPTIMLFVGP